jgi:predicted TIM-barrel fold metal-dependent hydrolase
MPVQRFAPMSKSFPTFDCDAHVAEPPWIWERAKEWLTPDEYDALKTSIWYDAEARSLVVNGRAGSGIGAQRVGGTPGLVNVLSLAGPGLKHDIQRAINVRNLSPDTAITQEQAAYLDHQGAYDPRARLRDMDVQGIDQVMIIPSDIDTYPWIQSAPGARAMCKAYNEWAYDYCQEDPERIFFAALLPMQDPTYATQELYRVAEKGCRLALVRPVDAFGNYPIQARYEPLWKAMEELGIVYGMHPFPAMGALKPPGYTAQYSPAELIHKTCSSSGLQHFFLTNVQNFQSEASLWVVMVLMSGFFERFPNLRAGVFEASSTWLSFLLDECDKYYKLYRNERQLPALSRLPSEGVLREHPRLVVRRVSPRRRRRVARHGDHAAVQPPATLPGEVPGREREEALRHRAAPEVHHRTRHGDRTTRLVAQRRRDRGLHAGRDGPASGRTPMSEGNALAVFDADQHVVEPHDVWERYLDAEYRTLGRHALWREEGQHDSYLKVNGTMFRDTMSSNIPRHAIWRPGMSWEDVGALDPDVRHPAVAGASDAKARIADMDAMGVDQAFLYPTWFAEGFHLVEDPDVAWALARAYNDWLTDFCESSPERLFAAAMLPLQNMDFSIAELDRIADRRCFRGVFIRPMFLEDRYFTHPCFEILYAELERRGLVAAVHPCAGLWNPEWTSHGPFFEKVKGRLEDGFGFPGGPDAGGTSGPGMGFRSGQKLGHPLAPILAPWLDNHMFVAAALIGFGAMQRYPDLKVTTPSARTPKRCGRRAMCCSASTPRNAWSRSFRRCSRTRSPGGRATPTRTPPAQSMQSRHSGTPACPTT